MTDRRKPLRRIAALGAALVLAVSGAHAVPLARDLRSAGLEAQGDCKPLLLEFSDSGCSYCHLLESEVLDPTLLNQDYEPRVLMRKLLLDSGARLRDFDGDSRVNAAQLASRYKVRVTPTLLFVDARGRELTERMVGVTTLEMYGGYLDAALDAARARLLADRRCDD